MFVLCCIHHIQAQPYKKRTAWRKSNITVTLLDNSEAAKDPWRNWYPPWNQHIPPEKRKIIFKSALRGDMLSPRRVPGLSLGNFSWQPALYSRKVPRCLCEGKPFIFEIVECLQGGPLLVIKGVNNPHEWPYKWVTGDITPISRVISFDPTYNW